MIIDAASHDTDDGCIEVLKIFNLNKRRQNDYFNNNERIAKIRADCTKEIEKECVDLHVNFEVSTRTDTKTFKFDVINDVKCPHRIWNHVCWCNRHKVFFNSDTHSSHRERHPHLTISKTVLKTACFSCVRAPAAHSCTNVTTSGLSEIMQALCKFYSQNASFKNSIDRFNFPLHR